LFNILHSRLKHVRGRGTPARSGNPPDTIYDNDNGVWVRLRWLCIF